MEIDRLLADSALPLSDLVLARPPFAEEAEEPGVGDLVEGREVVGEAGFVDILRPSAPEAGSFSFVVDIVAKECCCNVVRRLSVGEVNGYRDWFRGDSYIWRLNGLRVYLRADMYTRCICS